MNLFQKIAAGIRFMATSQEETSESLYRLPGKDQKARSEIFKDHRINLTSYTHRQMVSLCRQLYAQFGPVRGAILEKATYSVCGGWETQYVGPNKDWGNKAENYLYEWHKIADVRGDPFSWYSDLMLGSIALDRDGDYGVILVKTASGWPQNQIISTHRIGSRVNGGIWNSLITGQPGFRITAGKYNGNWEYLGVVFNDSSRAIAYHVLGDTPEQDQYVSSYDMFLNYDPEWSDQGRGVPSFAHALTDCVDIKDIRDAELLAVHTQSAHTLVEANGTGEADATQKYFRKPTTDTPTDVTVEYLDHGMVRHIKHGEANLEMFPATRPGDSYIPFVKHIMEGVYQGIEWDARFTADPSELGGVNGRVVIAKIKRTVDKRVKILCRHALRTDQHALAVGMKNGLLPWEDTWWMIEHTAPRQITADAGHDSKARVEEYKIGMSTLKKVYAENGEFWEEGRAQIEKEALDLIVRAQRIVKASEDKLSLQEAITLIRQASTNPSTPQSGTIGTDEPPAQPIRKKISP